MQRMIIQRAVGTKTVEIKIHRSVGQRQLRLQPVVQPVAHVNHAATPGAILRAQAADRRDVRPAKTRLRLAFGFVNKRQSAHTAVTDRRFRDGHHQRHKTIGLINKFADVQPAVLSRTKFGGSIGGGGRT